jgi:dihydroorotase
MPSELLRQVRLLDPVSRTDRIADVLLIDGTIQAIEEHLADYPEGTQVHDCQGCILGPGLVDLYSHSGEPGFEDRETLESLAQAAIAGGFTRMHLLPDTQPVIDRPATVEWLQTTYERVQAQSQRGAYPQLRYWGALTLGVKGEQMTELTELATAGVVGFADGQALSNLGITRRLLDYLQPQKKPIALVARDRHLVGDGVMQEGADAVRFGLPGTPASAETTALAALLELIETTGTAVHLMRIATARGVELIQQSKTRGVPITASTTWMHLLLNSQHLHSYNPHLKLQPPLGSHRDQLALQNGLRTGILDAIAIDHTPYTFEETALSFAEAPSGAIGLELALPLLWQQLVATGEWSALELWGCLSTKPAQCLNQAPVSLALGQPAELTLFNPHQSWMVEPQQLRSRSANTFWLGQPLTGRVVKVWCPLTNY